MTPQPVNIHFAKTHLSRLIEQVAAGESVVIANAGRPVARLVPYEDARRTVAPPGSLAGRGYVIGPDFDAPLDPLFGLPEPPTGGLRLDPRFDDPYGQADGV